MLNIKIMKYFLTHFLPGFYLVIRSTSGPNFLLSTLYLNTPKEYFSFNVLRSEKLKIKPKFTAKTI